jgi:hypothetical protein
MAPVARSRRLDERTLSAGLASRHSIDSMKAIASRYRSAKACARRERFRVARRSGPLVIMSIAHAIVSAKNEGDRSDDAGAIWQPAFALGVAATQVLLGASQRKPPAQSADVRQLSAHAPSVGSHA